MTTPTLASFDTAATAFLTPTLRRAPASEEPTHWVSHDTGPVAVWSAGAGPAVLLVHGWEGDHRDLEAYVEPLLSLGHRVVMLDLPAHGRSAGHSTSIPHSAEAVLTVAWEHGPFAAVVAHSIGSAVTAMALHQGLATDRVILIAPPSRYVDYARSFAQVAGVPADGLLDALRSRGIDIDNIDLPRLAPHLPARALVVHSEDDRVVPVSSGRAIARAWPNAELLEVQGLGHKRILGDEGVIWAVTSFIGR